MPALVTIAASGLRRQRELGAPITATLAPADTLIRWNMSAILEGAAVEPACMAPANTIRADTLIKENMPVILEGAAVESTCMAAANTIRADTLMKVNTGNSLRNHRVRRPEGDCV
jgi:hypothetical protein